MGGDLPAALSGDLRQRLLGHRQHAAGAAGTVVHQIGSGVDPVGDGQEDELRHQAHGIARGPVLAGLLIVLLVEAADQLLEDRAHRVVIQAGVLDRAVAVADRVGAEVHVLRQELLDQRAERVGLRELRDQVAKLEVLQNVLDVRREAVEIGLEVGLELLLAGAGPEVAQRELRGVVERLTGGLSQRLVLLDDPGLVEAGLQVEHLLLARFEHRVEPAQYGHRQDHVAVLPADVDIAQHVIRDAPDEAGDPVESTSLQAQILPIFPVLNRDHRAALIPKPGDWQGFNSAITSSRTTSSVCGSQHLSRLFGSTSRLNQPPRRVIHQEETVGRFLSGSSREKKTGQDGPSCGTERRNQAHRDTQDTTDNQRNY